MRIGLNLLHARPEVGGVWNYIQSTLSVLNHCGHNHEYVAYCTPQNAALVPSGANWRAAVLNFDNSRRSRRVAIENAVLPWRVKRDGVQVMHWLGNTQSFLTLVPAVVTIYDLFALEPGQPNSLVKQLYLRTIIPYTIRRAAILAPMSHTTASAIQVRFPGVQERVNVVPPAIDDAYQRGTGDEVALFRSKYGLPDRFWLYVAHFYPHKNHCRLLEAYSQFIGRSGPDWPLVLRCDTRGQDHALREMARRFGVEDRVIWLQRLADNEMPLLYSSATALIFPSLSEGGGIPVIEAMACGCPVAASDIPTTREFAGASCLQFDPQSVDAIAQAMMTLASDEKLREMCIERGIRTAQRHRIRNVYPALLRAYEKAL